MITLYAIAQRELAKDLLFEIDDEVVTLSVKGIMIAKSASKTYNFSFVEVTDNEFVLAVQMKGYVIYLGLESDEIIDEDAYPELVRALINHLLPSLHNLAREAEKRYQGKADLLLDDNMSAEMKEFFYELLLKHQRGLPIHEQVDVA
ncbi:hypothetical protein K1720_08715 [Thermococcus argininiproducens]|uniref:Uncharacterized protein n=1 Tax=Thermococcus argininiproducens TaxID=2866384 RepID=A0A9E7M9T4_9EURY|nr:MULTISPECIES: hypothetical protein [Thermococcus]KPU63430.1 hypothetical protein EP1X_03570 [Thermococcus sp. EP1]MCD6140728.1 hypothetical protein [Thermococcus sp.]MCD6144544.1 hypothetical protein [Thermococcus sp.]NJE25611.1 hypothetical protein [Thermococcus sp. MV5]USG99582.1 hypothetical protein K1720_08715 [Thermococcus argininiproducens]